MKEQLIKYKDYLLARGQSLVYYNFIKKFLEYCKTKKINYKNITQENITQFFNTPNKKGKLYKLNSKDNFIKSGRNYGKFLEISKEQNEWHKIKLLKGERKIPNYLTENDLREAIKYLITYHSNKISISKIEALMNFLFYSTIRKTELLGLKRTDFNLEERTVKVYGKGKKERILYYPTKVKKNLEDYFNSEIETINAFNLTKAKINYIPRILRKYFKDRKITVHLFRHSGARSMIRKGIPIGIVSKILGHSNISTTIIYTDPDEKMIKEMYMEKMK